MTTTKCTT